MGKRSKQDQYLTHVAITDKLVSDLFPSDDDLPPGLIIEPSAGRGSFVSSMGDKYPNRKIFAIDVEKEFEPDLLDLRALVRIKDFFRFKLKATKPVALVAGNPPFSLAKEFVLRALEMTKPFNGRVIFLLRGAFLETPGRLEIVRDAPLRSVTVLSRRPPFVRRDEDGDGWRDDGNDMAMYGLFEWDWSWEFAPYIQFTDHNWRKLIEEAKLSEAVRKQAPTVEK